MKVHRWQNQNQWFQQRRDPSVWCCAARGARVKILRRNWDIGSIWGMSMKDKAVKLAQGNLCRPPEAQKSIFSSEKTGKSSKCKSWKQDNREVSSHISSLRKLARTSDSKNRKQNHQYIDEGLPFKEVGNHSRTLNIFDGSIKDKRVDMEMFMCGSQRKQPFILDQIMW